MRLKTAQEVIELLWCGKRLELWERLELLEWLEGRIEARESCLRDWVVSWCIAEWTVAVGWAVVETESWLTEIGWPIVAGASWEAACLLIYKTAWFRLSVLVCSLAIIIALRKSVTTSVTRTA